MLKFLLGLIIIVFGAFKTFSDSFWGLVTFSVFTHMTPQQLGYRITSFRAPLLFSILTLGTYLISSKYPKKFGIWPIESKLMLFMYAAMKISGSMAFDPEAAASKSGDFFKFTIFFILFVNIINTPFKIEWFMNAVLFSAAWMVYRCFTLRGTTGARFENRDGGAVADANHFAAACVLLFPIVVRRIFKGPWWMRVGAAMGAFGLAMTIMITGSRGGFLGLIVTCIMTVLLYRGRRKQILISLIVMSMIAMPFVPEHYKTRIAGLFGKGEENVDEDASANSRKNAWKVAREVWYEMPWFGCGMNNFGYYNGHRHEELPWGVRGHVAHSLWFEVLAEGGIMLGVPFVWMLLLFFYRTTKVRIRYADTPYEYLAEDIYVLQIGFIGFLLSATFINRFMYETIYWWCALAVVHQNVQEKLLKEGEEAFPDSEKILSPSVKKDEKRKK